MMKKNKRVNTSLIKIKKEIPILLSGSQSPFLSPSVTSPSDKVLTLLSASRLNTSPPLHYLSLPSTHLHTLMLACPFGRHQHLPQTWRCLGLPSLEMKPQKQWNIWIYQLVLYMCIQCVINLGPFLSRIHFMFFITMWVPEMSVIVGS